MFFLYNKLKETIFNKKKIITKMSVFLSFYYVNMDIQIFLL